MKTYGQYCGLAKALDLVGERWTLLIVRNLLLGPLRYSELLRGLPGITTNLLAKRLKDMSDSGIVEKTSPVEGSAAYQLTELGWALEPAVQALGQWGGHRMQTIEKDDTLNVEWFLASLRRRYTGGLAMQLQLTADGVPYRVELTKKSIEIQRGSVRHADLHLRGESMALMRYLSSSKPLKRLPKELSLEHGKQDDLRKLVQAFSFNG